MTIETELQPTVDREALAAGGAASDSIQQDPKQSCAAWCNHNNRVGYHGVGRCLNVWIVVRRRALQSPPASFLVRCMPHTVSAKVSCSFVCVLWHHSFLAGARDRGFAVPWLKRPSAETGFSDFERLVIDFGSAEGPARWHVRVFASHLFGCTLVFGSA